MRQNTQWEMERFSLGLHLEPGFNNADRYTLEEAVNVEISEDGSVVPRKGCRRIMHSWTITSANEMLVTDIDGIQTILLSEIDPTFGSVGQYGVGVHALVGGTIVNTGGTVGSGLLEYKRGTGTWRIESGPGWRFVKYRTKAYMTSGDPRYADTGATKPIMVGGMYRWSWFRSDSTSGRLADDWGPDDLQRLRDANSALTTPSIRAVPSALDAMYGHIRTQAVLDEAGRRLRRTKLPREWETPKSGITETTSLGGATGLAKGKYFYAITYVRGDSLGESEPYWLDVTIPEDSSVVGGLDYSAKIMDIPTHPDSTVSLVRIYRNISPELPGMRILTEFQNGTSTYTDDGKELAVDEPLIEYSPPPAAHVIHAHNGRIFVAGTTTSGLAIFWSAKGEPENFDLGRDFMVLDAQLGVRAEAMGSTGIEATTEDYSGSLLIFTPTSVSVLHGDPPDVVHQVLSSEVGCVAYRTVRSFEGRCFWLAKDGVYASDGKNLVRISEPSTWSKGDIAPRLRGVAATILKDACAAVSDGKYWLALQDSRGIKTVYVFDIIKGLWTEHDYPFDIVALSTYRTKQGDYMLYALSSGAKGFLLNVGDRDENEAGTTTNITIRARLNANWFGNKAQLKHFRLIHLGMQRNTAFTLKTFIDNAGLQEFQTAGSPKLSYAQTQKSEKAWDDGWKWDDGTAWVDRGVQRTLTVPLDVLHQGRNLRVEIQATNYLKWNSLGVEFRRGRQGALPGEG